MGTETREEKFETPFLRTRKVKLNNPLMGTET